MIRAYGKSHIKKAYSIFRSIGKVFRRFFLPRLWVYRIGNLSSWHLPKKDPSTILLVSDRFSPNVVRELCRNLESTMSSETGQDSSWLRQDQGQTVSTPVKASDFLK
jgi:hypothetical protein